jgi:DNA-binding YbaB/EbfC family protein
VNKQFKQMMAQAQKMQQSLVLLQEELAGARIESASGPIRATVTGSGELVGLSISSEAFEAGDSGMLEDMVLAAVRGAVEKSREYSSSRMKELGLPDAGAML